jgi:hypothetical protein
MQVMFSKVDNGRLYAWRAACPKGKPFQGTTMASGKDLPHDLAQFVVEATLGLQHGFWGLLTNGATFQSVIGRRRTKPGQQLIRAHREALNAAEHVANTHVTAWRTGSPTSVGPALDTMFARWQALAVGEELLVDWQTQRLPPMTRGRSRRACAMRQRVTSKRY